MKSNCVLLMTPLCNWKGILCPSQVSASPPFHTTLAVQAWTDLGGICSVQGCLTVSRCEQSPALSPQAVALQYLALIPMVAKKKHTKKKKQSRCIWQHLSAISCLFSWHERHTPPEDAVCLSGTSPGMGHQHGGGETSQGLHPAQRGWKSRPEGWGGKTWCNPYHKDRDLQKRNTEGTNWLRSLS